MGRCPGEVVGGDGIIREFVLVFALVRYTFRVEVDRISLLCHRDRRIGACVSVACAADGRRAGLNNRPDASTASGRSSPIQWLSPRLTLVIGQRHGTGTVDLANTGLKEGGCDGGSGQLDHVVAGTRKGGRRATTRPRRGGNAIEGSPREPDWPGRLGNPLSLPKLGVLDNRLDGSGAP
jgi:hypothetical protein